ncbi:MAG: hypothetical protein NZ749_01795 [bacterium]|nr:hypothetical protein [bacterium]
MARASGAWFMGETPLPHQTSSGRDGARPSSGIGDGKLRRHAL